MKLTDLERHLTSNRRTDTVDDALHGQIMSEVAQTQRAEVQNESVFSSWKSWAALGSASAALVVIALVANLPDPEAPAQSPQQTLATEASVMDSEITTLLEQRLTKPLESLQALQVTNPLEVELAALESDLTRLRPRLPWQSTTPSPPTDSPPG